MPNLSPGDSPAFAIQDYIQCRDNDWNELNRALRIIWEDFDVILKKLNDYPGSSDLVTIPYGDAHYGANAVKKALIASGNLSQFPFLDGISNGAGGNINLTVGTLVPNTKPFFFTVLDAYKQVFYALDFDRMFIWTGFAWLAINYNAGAVSMFITAPTTYGWRLCNGGSATMSLPDGGVTSISVPNLTASAGTYMKAAGSYSGPTATAANAPTITGAPTGTISTITPTGSVTGNLPDHPHSAGTLHTQEALNISDDADWAPSGDIGGTVTGDLPDHPHALSPDNAHTQEPLNISDDGAWEPAGTVGGTAAGTTGNESTTHTHGVSVSVDTGPPDDTVAVTAYDPESPNPPVYVATDIHEHTVFSSNDTATESNGHTHSASLTVTGTFTSTSLDHYHKVTGHTEGIGDEDDPGPFPLDLTLTATFTDTSQLHYHVVVGHTGGIGDESDPGPFPLSLTFTGNPVTPTFTGNKGTLAVGADGEPMHMGMLPYLRL